jgi:hypothetical protein
MSSVQIFRSLNSKKANLFGGKPLILQIFLTIAAKDFPRLKGRKLIRNNII